MRPADQIRGEKYNINDTIKVYVKRVSDSKDMNVLVSRSLRDLSGGFSSSKCQK